MRDDCYVSELSRCKSDSPIPPRPERTVCSPIQHRQLPGESRQLPADEPNDHFLIAQTRAGDQAAATQLYLRYAKRLTSLVERRCSVELARCAGVEDIVQSVFATFFDRVCQGFYDIPDGDTVWKLLLVMGLNSIRTHATYHFAAKRDAHRTISGPALGSASKRRPMPARLRPRTSI